MNTILKTICLALYAAGACAAAGLLPASLSLLAPAAALLLAAHVLEGLAMYRLVRRHPGSLPASVVLTLLFGMLHLLPLRSRPA